MNKQGSNEVKHLSNSVRVSVLKKRKEREYNRRKALVQSLMKQHKCGVKVACEHYRNLHPFGVPEDVVRDLRIIQRELGGDVTREHA